MEPHHIAALAICLAACAYDLRTRRIPNVLTFGAAGLALGFHAFAGGLASFGTSFAGWVVGLALLVPLFWLGGMGGGDVKLLAALGAWMGPRDVVWVALCSAIAGGALGATLAFAHGYLVKACRNLWALVGFWLTEGLQPMPAITLDRAHGPRLAYAVPILAGVVVTVWLN